MRPSIEILEARIAPASLLDGHTLLFTDADGDAVKVVFSKDVFSGTEAVRLALANQVFLFDTGTVAQETTTFQQLQKIDLTKLPVVAGAGSIANGVGITITATSANGGNGFVDIGAVDALGVSVGKLVIDGDLGRITAGGSGLKIGLAGLTVESIGQRGIATQAAGGNLVSTITGEFTSLLVADDIKEARIRVLDGLNSQSQVTTLAKLGTVVIGGSLIGRTAVEAASDNTGLIESQREIGAITIGTVLNDGIVGGGGQNSGRISAGGKIASLTLRGGIAGGGGLAAGSVFATGAIGSVTINGSLVGGAGERSGTLQSNSSIGAIKIGATTDQGITGAGGLNSGDIIANGSILSLSVGGDLKGGTGVKSGFVYGKMGIGSVNIGGDLVGSGVDSTGFIQSDGSIGAVVVGRDAQHGIVGGAGTNSGAISAGGKLLSAIVNGDVKGGAGSKSGAIYGKAGVGNVTINGSLIGGGGENSGLVQSDSTLGLVMIGTDAGEGITGGAGRTSGRISAASSLLGAKISGNVSGAGGASSGTIFAGGAMGTIIVGGDLAGGVGNYSARILAYGNIASVQIGDDLISGKGQGSATVYSLGTITKAVIKGDVDGTTAEAGAQSAGLYGNNLPLVTIEGSIKGGVGAGSGFVQAGRVIGSAPVAPARAPGGVTILHDVLGGAGNNSGVVIAGGMANSIVIKGNLTGGSGLQSGSVITGFDPLQLGTLRLLSVAGKIQGGSGDSSGAVIAKAAIMSVSVGTLANPVTDVLVGGDGDFSGSISARGTITSAKLLGNLVGDDGDRSGAILAYERTDARGEFAGNLGALTIAGTISGGAGLGSGSLHADGSLVSLASGAWIGGIGASSGSLETGGGLLGDGNAGTIKVTGLARAAVTPGQGSATFIIGGKLNALTVAGATSGATIRAADNIASLSFLGNVTDSLISARGQAVPAAATDLAIGKLSIVGNVANSSFLAGYGISGSAVNPDAQIGPVTVAGNWTASDLVAGAIEGSDAGFGNAGDLKAPGSDSTAIVSRIASLLITGTVAGSGVNDDHFGFVAQLIVKAKIGSTVYALNGLPDGQSFTVGDPANGVTIREIPVS